MVIETGAGKETFEYVSKIPCSFSKNSSSKAVFDREVTISMVGFGEVGESEVNAVLFTIFDGAGDEEEFKIVDAVGFLY